MRVEAKALWGGSSLNWGYRDGEGAELRKYCGGRVPGHYCLLDWGMKSRLGEWGGEECWIPFWPIEPPMSGTNIGRGTGRAVVLVLL